MRVSELITCDTIRQWSVNDTISITAGTGAGKSYWVKNILYLIAAEQKEKILFLIHRSNCINQFQNEILKDNKQDVIDIMSYQKLEAHYLKYNEHLDLREYKYIVCDEFHYFLSDATFNKSTDLSLNNILDQKAIKVFMSATSGAIEGYLTRFKNIELVKYELPIKFDFINKLCFFNKDITNETIINYILNETNDKAIIFINSAEKAYRLFKKYEENAIFNCSQNNSKHYKYVDKDLIDDMLANEKFDKRILITTSCLDAGVNLIDDKLKYIVINDIFDIEVIKQMIGRKRLKNKDDYINLYIKSYNNNQLGGIKTKLTKRIERANYFKKYGSEKYIDKYFKDNDRDNIIYDTNTENGFKKVLNELMYYKLVCDIVNIAAIQMNKSGKYLGFNIYVSNCLQYKDNYIFIEEENTKMNLNEYLEMLIGEKLDKDKQKELIDMIDLKVNGRKQKSYNKLNEGLKMLKLPYIIIPKKSNNQRYWIIEKIEE